jgi:PAS domain S-box-containing protein
MLIVDPVENVVFANRACCRILGYSKDEIVGMNLSQIVPNEEFEKILNQSSRRREGVSSQYELMMRRRDGELRNMSVSAHSWMDETGEFLGSTALVMDITERKRADENLRIYADVLENINIGIVAFDTEKKSVIFQNRCATEMLQPTVERRDYSGLTELLLPNGGEGMKGVTQEVRCGDRILGYTVYHLLGRYLWLFIREITEKVRLESIAEAANSTDNIGYIFSGIRHEIGNPLNSIKVTMSVLKENIDRYPKKKVLEYIDAVLEVTERLEYLLKSLKSFNMYEDVELQDVGIVSLMENFLLLSRHDIEKRGIQIDAHFPPTDLRVRVDPRALQQCLLNLLTNAVDSLEDRKAPRITIDVSAAASRVSIRVDDNGCGIPERKIGELFMPFATTKEKGSGLGLVIVKKLLARMHSTIEVESAEGEGTSVEISLPLLERQSGD